MWCSRCQQDVPAVATIGDSSVVCCARCGDALTDKRSPPYQEEAKAGSPGDDISPGIAEEGDADTRTTTIGSSSTLPVDLDDWKLEDDLREAQRLVRLIQLQSSDDLDWCDSVFGDDEDRDDDLPRRRGRRGRSPQKSRASGSLAGWALVGLGLSGLVCGCALLVWSYVTGRGDLWNIGLPVALVSQAVLTCGVIVQADRKNHAQPADDDEREVGRSGTHWHLHPAGLSVHFSGQALPGGDGQLERQIDAAIRRAA